MKLLKTYRRTPFENPELTLMLKKARKEFFPQTKKKHYARYLRVLIKYSKRHRKHPTPAEKSFFKTLKSLSLKVRPQYVIAPYIVDFFLPAVGIAIEIDGSYHTLDETKEKDNQKDAHLRKLNIIVLRFKNEEVFNGSEKILEAIKNAISSRGFYSNEKVRLNNGEAIVIKRTQPSALERRIGY